MIVDMLYQIYFLHMSLISITYINNTLLLSNNNFNLFGVSIIKKKKFYLISNENTI